MTPAFGTDGVFSAEPDDPDSAVFHSAVDLDDQAIRTAGDQPRHRGPRCGGPMRILRLTDED